MSDRPFELWLIWENVETRQRYHIGTLLDKDGVFSFNYELASYKGKLRDAMDNGYRAHLAFPDINKDIYIEKVIWLLCTQIT